VPADFAVDLGDAGVGIIQTIRLLEEHHVNHFPCRQQNFVAAAFAAATQQKLWMQMHAQRVKRTQNGA
jgi:hypothetical protein